MPKGATTSAAWIHLDADGCPQTAAGQAGAWRSGGEKLKIAFVLTRRFTLTPFALFIDVLRLTGDDGDRSRRLRCDWHILGEKGLPIDASCGARILPTASFDSMVDYDSVVVVGGLLDSLLPLTLGMERFLRAAAARGTSLIGLCTGSFVLAELGFLDGRRASVSWFHVHEFRQRYPAVNASAETLFTVDERVSTCSGGVGAADLAAEFVRGRLNDTTVEDAAKNLLLDGLRDGGAPQPQSGAFLRARDRLVRRALLFMEGNLSVTHPIAAVASRVGCSTRQLQRRFLADVGTTPSQAYMRIRIQFARQLLVRTDRAVEDVGASVGFGNPSHFARVFRKTVGQTPMRFRSRRP